ncbi:Hypothetical protein D9617_14g075910 [Elsinoe fawcettii]|nr:Hypothetical protein D9617_14g075910 [Elsinoe fawcettii]
MAHGSKDSPVDRQISNGSCDTEGHDMTHDMAETPLPLDPDSVDIRGTPHDPDSGHDYPSTVDSNAEVADLVDSVGGAFAT